MSVATLQDRWKEIGKMTFPNMPYLLAQHIRIFSFQHVINRTVIIDHFTFLPLILSHKPSVCFNLYSQPSECWTPTSQGLNCHLWLVAPVSGSGGMDVKVPFTRVRMFPSHKAPASASSHTPGPAAWPTGLLSTYRCLSTATRCRSC